jgi:hypothetical protein
MPEPELYWYLEIQWWHLWCHYLYDADYAIYYKHCFYYPGS